jgi:hypothetical protein
MPDANEPGRRYVNVKCAELDVAARVGRLVAVGGGACAVAWLLEGGSEGLAGES